MPINVFADEPPVPYVVPRADWQVAEPKYELMHKQTPLEIVIHHTGEPQRTSLSLEKKLRNLQDFSLRKGSVGVHMKPAWGDVPYHFYIDVKGRIGEGRDINFAGANTRYHTLNKVQVVVEGDFEKEQPTEDQLKALQQLIHWLRYKYKIRSNLVFGHNDLAKTDCPGKNLKPFVLKLQTEVDQIKFYPLISSLYV